ncbi:MAG: DUF420 domain-containing protein [Bdellovibrionota bacterium]
MSLPSGFLGTRANILMDFVVIGIVVTPLLMLFAFRLAREKRFVAHRNLHALLITLLLSIVAAFELDIRLSGGSKAFLRGSPFADSSFLHWFLIFHVSIAVCSFIGWIWLEKKSWNSFLKALPGEFSSSHVRLGKCVFNGVVATAVTGVGLYIIGFAL